MSQLPTCYTAVEYYVIISSLPGFFKILTIFDYHSFLTANDLTLGLVRFELVFSLFNSLSDPNVENDRYLHNFIIFLKEFSIEMNLEI